MSWRLHTTDECAVVDADAFAFAVVDMDVQDCFDWDAPLDEIFGITVAVMDRNEPDVSMRVLDSDVGVAMEIDREFAGQEYLQLVVTNRDEETKAFCPYFRIIMNGLAAYPGERANPHLESFYKKIGMDTLDARVDKAVVVGLFDLLHMDKTISVPVQFCVSGIAEMEIGPELDSTCLKPCARSLYKQADLALYDIAGLCIPYHIPYEAQWKILSFLRSPTAEIIENKISDICMTWDVFLWPMFVQREPRIPCHIAQLYGAATVQNMINAATRSFLAPSVPRLEEHVVSV